MTGSRVSYPCTTTSTLVGGLQLDTGLVYAGSLLTDDAQDGDELTFVGDDGNLPTTTAV